MNKLLKRVLLLGLFYLTAIVVLYIIQSTASTKISETNSVATVQTPQQKELRQITDPKQTAAKDIYNLIHHAYESYSKYAVGSDELNPLQRAGHNWTTPSALFTPVDSLDTLFIIGDKKMHSHAKKLVLSSLDFDAISQPVNVFETTIRILGGLLSAYDQEQDTRILLKATDLADRLMVVFDSPTGFPDNAAVLSSRKSSRAFVALATAGTLQLEFQYLSDVTGNKKYSDAALAVYERLHALPRRYKGLYPLSMTDDTKTDTFHYSIAAEGDSFYEYLLKLSLSTGEQKYRDWYEEAAQAVIDHLLVRAPNNIAYLPDRRGSRHDDYFHHLSCFAGGMFALGAMTSKNKSLAATHLAVAADLTETCYKSYRVSKSGLGGESIQVTSDGKLIISNPTYLLRPELVESIFYMWRATHDPKYREWGTRITESIIKNCKTPTGFVGLRSDGSPNDRQESFFLAETLKYLYLLFSDDSVVPLDKYVFNTEAHPFNRRGHGVRKDPKKWIPIP